MTNAPELLARAAALTEDGRGAEAIGLFDRAATLARDADDVPSWTSALLGLTVGQRFDIEVAALPARLYELYIRVHDQQRRRAAVAASLARCWAYTGVAVRGLPFADQAVDIARGLDDADLLVDALDAALSVHWGPDDLATRTDLAREIDEHASHTTDTDAHTTAHLWALTVACERLDLPQMHRQIRALEILGEKSARARFFAASRRLMLDLLRGRTDTATMLRDQTVSASAEAFIPDAEAVLHAMTAYTAVIGGDRDTCLSELGAYEEYGLAEGVPVVLAEGAFIAAQSGETDRARALVGQVSGALDSLPRDHNWLLTMQCILEAALACDDADTIRATTELLTPYEDRAVINAGAVMFHGVTDDPLSRAHRRMGNADAAFALREQALRTYRRIGAQWWVRRLLEVDTTPAAAVGYVLRPLGKDLWEVGGADSPTAVRAMRGFEHLHRLVASPGTEISASDLVGATSGATVTQSGLAMLDEEAREAYRRRLDEIEELLPECGPREADRLTAERDALRHELGSATGLSGRRRTTGASAERARVTVRKAIVGALAQIGEIEPAMARHLHRCVRTGTTCSYTSDDPEVHWRT